MIRFRNEVQKFCSGMFCLIFWNLNAIKNFREKFRKNYSLRRKFENSIQLVKRYFESRNSKKDFQASCKMKIPGSAMEKKIR